MEKSISNWHGTCYKAFAALIQASSDTDNCSEQLPHDVLIDLAGRFNVWAGNIGAGQQGRASLDYRLREATYIQETVIQTLMYLNESLRKGWSAVSFAVGI